MSIKLSLLEQAVLELIAKGYSQPQIRQTTKLPSEYAVKSTFRRIYEKLGANNAPSAVNKAWSIGILGYASTEKLVLAEDKEYLYKNGVFTEVKTV